MSTALKEETVTSHTSNDDELHHLYCTCNEDIALCGTDISEDVYLARTLVEALCVVCEDLEWKTCSRCDT